MTEIKFTAYEVSSAVGRVGEYIAYHYLKERGDVLFSAIDFELNGRPVEVKTTVERRLIKSRYSHPAGAFMIRESRHVQLCKWNGLYCFVLLKDDGYAAVKLKPAQEIQYPKFHSLKWTHIFEYEVTKSHNKRVCIEPSFMNWRSLLSESVLTELDKRK